ncbi:MAG: hypothetical protein V1853_05520 [bacterium]
MNWEQLPTWMWVMAFFGVSALMALLLLLANRPPKRWIKNGLSVIHQETPKLKVVQIGNGEGDNETA